MRAADVPFLEVLAAAGQAVTRVQLLRGKRAGLSEAPAAIECPECGHVTGDDE